MIIDRRRFLATTLGTGLGCTWSVARCAAQSAGRGTPDLIKAIDRQIIWNGRAGGTTWFHPRACMLPGSSHPTGFMTLQSISGSDVYGPVHWSVTSDIGKTWSDPRPVPGWGRRKLAGTLEEGVCDVVPEYHAKTGTILAIGHNVWYEKGVLRRPQLKRHPVYVVRSPDGAWSEPQILAWDDPRGSQIYTCGCSQRVTLDDGSLIIAFSFAPEGADNRSVASVRCDFDGRTVVVRRAGNELQNKARRGLLEPSLACFEGRFYMTIRAEDNRGYVSVSEDGLEWKPQVPWCWDDGEPLAMSTTQQHWLSHPEALYLVYTRKDVMNVNVPRWRSPLYAATVDLKTLRLVRSTERVVFPLSGDGVRNGRHVAHLGNFHTNSATPDESWVTVGECLPDDGWRGDLMLARVRWNRPHRPG